MRFQRSLIATQVILEFSFTRRDTVYTAGIMIL
nr:MAG TPA: hypothetical protein [Caudoviricetes sp.]